MRLIDSVGVMGAGAWGTALAQVAAAAGRKVTLWAFERDVAEGIARSRENAAFLPGVPLHRAITPTNDLAALTTCDVVLAAVPAQHLRGTLQRFAPLAPEGLAIVSCAKGVEQGTLKLMTQVIGEVMPASTALVLSGPGFAKDVARGLPTATTIAARDPALAQALVAAVGLPTFRPYVSDDPVGAEIGGAVKNVIAIACGVAEGRALGEGARAALITRGFAELTRLGRVMGAKLETLNGLCGLGDLVLTCASLSSRNTSLGAALGRGQSLVEALSGKRSVAEGAASAPAVLALAQRAGVEMPICHAVAEVLSGALSVDGAIEALLSRPFRAEGF